MKIFDMFHKLDVSSIKDSLHIPKILIDPRGKYNLSMTAAAIFTTFLVDYSKNKINPIYADIDSLQSFKDIWGLGTADTIKQYLKRLDRMGFLNVKRKEFTYPEIFKILNKKNSINGCLFCGYDRVLHKHHYPISRTKGGTDIIRICPNCHSEFHLFTNSILMEITICEEFLNENKDLIEEINTISQIKDPLQLSLERI